uniref:1,3-beta-glucan synthase n=1 Tax=Calcidiscus leptoporus TaxID=127549 RepID=A0A7S0NMX1_9EUKA|mmetsp:Transcript_10698/g.24837  ORF Transcript_10698/g.24837 Transcript_10698/m.24837 type:complete len:1863 (+) Transcript_10698:110-5698(+)
MRRASNAMADKNMSYTNLAAMAESFETYNRFLPSRGQTASGDNASFDSLHEQAMEHINTALRMDQNSPLEAIAYYEKGGDVLSRALELAPPGEKSNKMQNTLNMVEARIRDIMQSVAGRVTDSQSTVSTPEEAVQEITTARPQPKSVLSQQAFNLFDTANSVQSEKLPRDVRKALRIMQGVFDDLVSMFGFQEESVRNQHEHLMLLLANSFSQNDQHGLSVLHSHMFTNYTKWTKALKVRPETVRDATGMVKDLALFLLIWGEAANLKHVPESLCFLFHQMRAELRNKRKPIPAYKPAGWFLSRVVAPLYRVMRAELTKKTGHTRHCNYDDINEFFWSSECLDYSYYTPEDGSPLPMKTLSSSMSPAVLETFGLAEPKEKPELAAMPVMKRYIERRSWLAPIRAFWRIHAFHLQMLHVLLCFVFCKERNGNVVDGRLLQGLSGVFVTHAALSTVQELLRVFILYGMLHTHGSQLLSLALNLTYKAGVTAVLGFYYYQMLLDKPFFAGRNVPPQVWFDGVLAQYNIFFTLAIVYAIPVTLSGLTQVFPFVSTWMRSWNGGPIKCLYDLIDPLNRLYVGKNVHVPCDLKLGYDFFWLSLLTFKFVFSYMFQLEPLAQPTRDIWAMSFDDSYLALLFPGKGPNLVVLFVRWAPMVLMYLLDTQIWYMLWTAAYGSVIGWSLHIGEVPDFSVLRERLVAASEHFNRKMLSTEVPLIYEAEPPLHVPCADKGAEGVAGLKTRAGELQESLLLAADAAGSEVRNESLRYFSQAWNTIINDLRASDLLSNHEQSLLLFNSWEGAGFSRCTYFPTFVTAGKLSAVFHLAKTLSEQGKYQALNKRLALERQLQTTIADTTPLREATVEFFELSRWLLVTILGSRHEEMLLKIVNEMVRTLHAGKVLDILSPAALPKLSTAIVDLSKTLLSVKLEAAEDGEKHLAADTNMSKVTDKLRAVVDALKAILNRNAATISADVETVKFTPGGFFWDDEYSRLQLEQLLQQPQGLTKLQGLVLLCSTAQLDAKPTHLEVNRRLTWFVGSLFMAMPKAPPVKQMKSWSVLTPFYSEDLLYSARELAAKNEDGVSVLYFLKTVHPSEWHNFLQRIQVKDEAKLFQDRDLLLELRLWASYRGQTLTRTVDGMMQNERALRLQASWEGIHGPALEELCRLKFSYVVSCQVYGQMKRNRDQKAADTEFLLQRFPNLRVAYVDKTTSVDTTKGLTGLREQVRFYTVLIKGAKHGSEEAVQQVYRVQLPGDIMLGEGKPENQNHAMIFTRGEALQTIDMNQSGYLEEAFKMRNMLQEFSLCPGSTILGFREHIFTGELSSLASYMALQEGCFVTLTQRVLWNPLRVRLHYGHPDIFDKVFSMTNGGISKASRGINLSEDIYAGFNHLQRGGTIPYIEYVQVGKGRDVGMQQIYKFEAKLASGNAEQCLSRDVARIGGRLDFSRGFSFYYSGPGFYFNNAATVFAMYFFLYLTLFMHILQLDAHLGAADLLNAQWTLQLGLLLSVPILCFMAVEYGLGAALKSMWQINISGSLLFFMFHMGTKAFYFDSTLKYGGAKYRPTGRGFVMRHEEFAELYRFYASSHLHNGFELLWGLLLLLSLGSWPHGISAYWRTTWSLWAVMFSWLFAPFWFNPIAFDHKKLMGDYKSWSEWMERKDTTALSSWESWWLEEHSFLNTSSWAKKLLILLPAPRYALTFVGILATLSRHSIKHGLLHELQLFASLLIMVLAFVLLVLVLPRALRDRPVALRMSSTLMLLVLAVGTPLALQHLTLFHVLHYAIATGYLFAALIRLPFACGSIETLPEAVRALVMLTCKAYDYLTGGFLIGLCFALSATQFMKYLQNRALLSDTFNQGVEYNRLARLLIQ